MMLRSTVDNTPWVPLAKCAIIHHTNTHTTAPQPPALPPPRSLRPNMFLDCKSPACGSILFASTEIVNRPKSHWTFLLIVEIYSKCVWKNKMRALGVCFPQLYSSAGCMFAATRSLLDYYWQIGSFLQRTSMKHLVNWLPLRIGVRSTNNPCLMSYSCDYFFFANSECFFLGFYWPGTRQRRP